MRTFVTRAFVLILGPLALAHPALGRESAHLDALIAMHASANGVPESLVRRVIVRESRYNARAIGRGGTFGLMQIKHATARGVGYRGPASGLLDPNTNLTYAVRYLAGAYRVAGGNADRAVSYYARGYYYQAKRNGMLAYASAAPDADLFLPARSRRTTGAAFVDMVGTARIGALPTTSEHTP